jgi:TDG/mug DNA glycosylase family protein
VAVGFPPVSNSDARVLILGSLPGRRSLLEREYYAQPQNVFWRIMGELCDAGPGLPYEQRLERLKMRGVALWDVLASAERKGSLDSAIVASSIEINDFPGFFRAHAGIGEVFFNGGMAEALYRRHVLPRLPPAVAALPRTRLPSTSPAHAARPFAVKLAAWSVVAARLR